MRFSPGAMGTPDIVITNPRQLQERRIYVHPEVVSSIWGKEKGDQVIHPISVRESRRDGWAHRARWDMTDRIF